MFSGISFGFLFVIILIIVIIYIFYFFSNYKNEQLLIEIEKLIKEKKYKYVIDICLKYQDKYKYNYKFYYYLAKAYEGLYQIRSAINYYKKTLVKIPSEGTFLRQDVYFKLAELNYQLNDYQNALVYLNIILNNDKSNPKALMLSSEIYYTIKEFNKAKNNLEMLLKIKSSDVKARFLLAKTLYMQGEYQKSIYQLKVLLQNYSSLIITYVDKIKILLAENHFELKQYNDVIKILEPLLEKNDILDLILPLYIKSLIKLKKFKEADDTLNSYAMRLSIDKRCDLLYVAAQSYLSEDQIYKSIELWKEIFNIQSDYKNVKQLLDKYKILIDNPSLINIFNSDDYVFENFISRKLNVVYDGILERNINYYIVKNNDAVWVIFRKSYPIGSKDFLDIEISLKTLGLSGYPVYLCSLFSVEEECKNRHFYKMVKEISYNNFIDKFK